MITLVGFVGCAAICAWYLGQEISDVGTRIEFWIRETDKGEWI